MTFILVTLGAILGNGLGAYNIRLIAKGNLKLLPIVTFVCVIVQQVPLREVYRNTSGIYSIAWALGSAIGITLVTYLDKKWLKS
jgi:hypothetical protein